MFDFHIAHNLRRAREEYEESIRAKAEAKKKAAAAKEKADAAKDEIRRKSKIGNAGSS